MTPGDKPEPPRPLSWYADRSGDTVTGEWKCPPLGYADTDDE